MEEKVHIAQDTGNDKDKHMLTFASRFGRQSICGKIVYSGLGNRAVDVILKGGKHIDSETIENICPDCLNKYKGRLKNGNIQR